MAYNYSLLDQPSAVGQMLSLLANQPPAGQPGQPAPMPAAPMNVPMQPPEPQQNLLGKIHDVIQNRLAGGVPSEYQQTGLLSDQDIQAAKPGIMQVLGHGDAYRKNLDRLLEMRGMATALAEHKRVMQSRADMPQGLDLPGMLKYAVQHGDVEMIKSLGGPLEGMLSTKPNAASANIKEVPGVGAVDFTDPAHPKVVMKAEATPRNIDPLSAAGIAAQLRLAEAKPGNPQQQLTAARASAGIAEMNNADSGLNAYEDKLINGSASIKGLEQFIGSVGDSFLLEDPKSKALQAAALTKLNTSNPELARYIRRGLSFAEGETGISQRPSDYRTKLAAFLSTASAGASPEMIADIRSRRSSILGAVNASKLAMKSSAKPKLTQAEYNAGRSKHSDAEIASHYDLSGVTRK